ncbi:hypothetical protein GIB67_010621 [Kingdonia uniflora]|uniref:DUF4283 domain-containing protein n=1 Tax=Kingdonia uniflora TaxID=39325 RepID=A0A7J7M842_9MAGN|nr:hypothetical protein GIB67_010621 [Kingdonia uniflora]
MENEVDPDKGPSPGGQSIPPSPAHSLKKEQQIENEVDPEICPSPGWHSIYPSPAQNLKKEERMQTEDIVIPTHDSVLLLDAFNKGRASLPQPPLNPPPLSPLPALDPSDLRTQEMINEKLKAEDLDSLNPIITPTSHTKPSFASIAAVTAVRPILEEFKPDTRVTVKDGIPVISFSPSDLSKAASAFNTTLIMSFPTGKPNLDVIESTIKSNWGLMAKPKVLAGLVGKYLITDSTTLSLSRPSTVRVCVEVNLMKELSSKVGLTLSKSFTVEQEVLYERLPQYYGHCMLQGHTKASCTKLQPIIILDKREEIRLGKASMMGTSAGANNKFTQPHAAETVAAKSGHKTIASGKDTVRQMAGLLVGTEQTVETDLLPDNIAADRG